MEKKELLIHQLELYVRDLIPFDKGELKEVFHNFEYIKIKKKDSLVKAGEVCKKVIFFNKGYFRFFHYLKDGNEITSDFYFAPGFVTSYTSLITGLPSNVYVQAMEDMDTLILHKNTLSSLYEKYHKLERLARLISEQVAIKSEQHLFSLLNQTAEERYKNLIETYPEFVKQIPLKYIASFLGIKQETLSRIRKKLN